MLRVFSELLIAVIFVSGVEAFVSLCKSEPGDVARIPLQLFGQFDRFAFFCYFLPVLALLMQTTQLAHYHLKMSTWGSTRRKIDQQIRGKWEGLLIASTSLSFLGLIAVSQWIADDGERDKVLLFWTIAYLGYLIGDILVKRFVNFDAADGKAKTAAHAAHCIDSVLFLVGLILGVFLWLEVIRTDKAVSLFSCAVGAGVIALYIWAKDFMLGEPESAS